MSKHNIDLSEQKFGKLTVLCGADNKGASRYWTCNCDCGGSITTRQTRLLNGQKTHCGCERTYTKKPKVMPEVKLSLMQRFADWFMFKKINNRR
jgi:hypothetical protein